jgi:hypothetical protein
MMISKEYDPIIAFDDLYKNEGLTEDGEGGEGSSGSDDDDVKSAVHKVARRIRGGRIHVAMGHQFISGDPTNVSFSAFAPVLVIGVDPNAASGFPVFDNLRKRFEVAIPSSKVVRVDTEASYEQFRDARRIPHIDNLEARLRALELAYIHHVSDPDAHHAEHAYAHLDHPESIEAAIPAAIMAVKHGGTPVPLDLPAWSASKIDCWKDGSEIICTIKVLGPDGQRRMITTGSPISACIDHVARTGDDVEPQVLGYIAESVGCCLGGEALVKELCGMTPSLIGMNEVSEQSHSNKPVIVAAYPKADPTMAAAMALLQLCQRGDQRACAEAASMSIWGGGNLLLREASDRLLKAQKDKSQGR